MYHDSPERQSCVALGILFLAHYRSDAVLLHLCLLLDLIFGPFLCLLVVTCLTCTTHALQFLFSVHKSDLANMFHMARCTSWFQRGNCRSVCSACKHVRLTCSPSMSQAARCCTKPMGRSSVLRACKCLSLLPTFFSSCLPVLTGLVYLVTAMIAGSNVGPE